MIRSELPYLPEYFDRYINLTDDQSLKDVFQASIEELDLPFIEKCRALGDKIYAPGKWTAKDIFQHLIDTERILSYRALAFARSETQAMPSFSEDGYAASANANNRTFNELIDELRLLHRSTQALFTSFSNEMLLREGQGFKGRYSVAALGFILAGHQRWHFKILEERYFPLL